MFARSRLAVALALMMALAGGTAQAAPLAVDVSGENGVVRATEPGLLCADDGEGSYRHYMADGRMAPGTLSTLAGTIRTTLDIHYDGPGALTRAQPNAFLLGTESHTTLANERGTVRIVLRGGNCEAPAIGFDGTTASLGGGTWSAADIQGTGAYRQVTGSGTYAFTAETNPGADNAWTLKLNGAVNVQQPGLTVKVERTYWGNLGLDYLSRVVTVVYRIGNTGPGDSFGSRFTKVSPPPGVKACGEPPGLLDICPNTGPAPRPLGDLASCADTTLPATCDTELITVRYQLPLLGGPCTLVILGCAFATPVETVLPDALDVATTKTATVTVQAPNLPPPL